MYKTDPRCVIDRSIVIHEDRDDCGKGTTRMIKNREIYNGNAGKRIHGKYNLLLFKQKNTKKCQMTKEMERNKTFQSSFKYRLY